MMMMMAVVVITVVVRLVMMMMMMPLVMVVARGPIPSPQSLHGTNLHHWLGLHSGQLQYQSGSSK